MDTSSFAHLKNYIFDADGTLLECENPYLSIARALQCESVVKGWVHAYLDGEMAYQELVDRETAIFIEQHTKIFGREPHTGDLEKYLPKVEIKPQAWEITKKLVDQGKHLYILSSGFLYLIRDLMQLQINLKNMHANRLLYDTSGCFVMVKVDVSGDKIDGYRQIIQQDKLLSRETVYIGDNAFDEKVIMYVLEDGGCVVFISDKEKEFKPRNLPEHERLFTVNNLEQLTVMP